MILNSCLHISILWGSFSITTYVHVFWLDGSLDGECVYSQMHLCIAHTTYIVVGAA